MNRKFMKALRVIGKVCSLIMGIISLIQIIRPGLI